MNHHQKKISILTTGKGFNRITRAVEEVVSESKIRTGLCTIFICHTSASLVIQENADPDVLVDLSNFFANLVPESTQYIHDTEGADDMPAHIRSVLTKTSEQIPINQSRLALGIWQGIYVWEHRASGHRRDIIIHISGL